MPDENNTLSLSFEPNTIEHLGVKMYSHIPPALAELIANSYDACSKDVWIRLFDQGTKKIEVQDNGSGMTFDEVNEYFLRIGRNRRKENQEASCDRTPTGKKGLGKLALFGIGSRITIRTAKDGEAVIFILDYDDILTCDDKDYEPRFRRVNVDETVSGTQIKLERLKRASNFSLEDYSVSIAKMFNFLDDEFKVHLSLNNENTIEIDNKLKYQNIDPEFKWDFQGDVIPLVETEYDQKGEIKGDIFTTEKPLKPGQRGITLFANGRMINSAEFFGRSDSSHFFSYATGWLDCDFIDNLDDDIISTDRQSISWDHELTVPLRDFLSDCLRVLENDWRDKRKGKRRDNVKRKTNVDVTNWLKTVPPEIAIMLETIVDKVDNSELSEDDQSEAIGSLHSLVPEYPKYHWRHLNDQIKGVSKDDYERADYLRAAEEAIKQYENAVKDKSEINDLGISLMGKSFGKNQEPLKITANKTLTENNIEEGQKHMSMGVMSGFRNPAMHETKETVHPEIFDDNDCLDLLSMISYLFNKLDKSRNINNE